MPRDIVSLLLEEYWDMTLPIQPEHFAEKLGLKIVHDNNMGFKSGFLDMENKEIHVNAKEPRVRQRFTIAHELGHYCLQHGNADRDTSSSDWVHDPHLVQKERNANDFAARLLMPAVAIKILVEKEKMISDDELASAFDVSREAIYWRMKNLGYFLKDRFPS